MPDPLVRIREARSQLEAAEREVDRARAAFYRAIASAYDDDGISLSAIGRELSVSRQRVRALVELGRRNR
jgi:DNA-directed RNA polymerase sigma subunit (sigma70/sigma32)